MKENRNLRIPDNFEDSGEFVMSNFDHEVDYSIAESIKDKPLTAGYGANNFFGHVWWNGEKWCCEIWVHRSYRETIIADTLPEIMSISSEKYGSE